MKSLIIVALFSMIPSLSFAKEVWNGSGKVFDTSGQEQHQFKVKVELDRNDSGQETTAVQVFLKNGTFTKNCTRENKGKNWTITCEDGKGYGVCLDQGQCQEYFIGNDGQHQATTINKDGDKMKLLTTILKDGKAIRFVSQSLTKD